MRRAAVLIGVSLMLIGFVAMFWMIQTQDDLIVHSYFGAFAASLIVATPFAAWVCVSKLRLADEMGPFGFDTVFKHVFFAVSWTAFLSILIYLLIVAFVPIGEIDAPFDGVPTSFIEIYSVLIFILMGVFFGAFFAFFFGTPLAIVISALFALIALEVVDVKSDKTS